MHFAHLLIMTLATLTACSSVEELAGAPTAPPPVKCVAGCFNEWCSRTFDFCLESRGACAPVPCRADDQCAGLAACDRSARNSKKFICDQGFCRRFNDTCLNECVADSQCAADQHCFCTHGTCCWCDIHRCERDSDCNMLGLGTDQSYACSSGRCVRR